MLYDVNFWRRTARGQLGREQRAGTREDDLDALGIVYLRSFWNPDGNCHHVAGNLAKTVESSDIAPNLIG